MRARYRIQLVAAGSNVGVLGSARGRSTAPVCRGCCDWRFFAFMGCLAMKNSAIHCTRERHRDIDRDQSRPPSAAIQCVQSDRRAQVELLDPHVRQSAAPPTERAIGRNHARSRRRYPRAAVHAGGGDPVIQRIARLVLRFPRCGDGDLSHHRRDRETMAASRHGPVSGFDLGSGVANRSLTECDLRAARCRCVATMGCP